MVELILNVKKGFKTMVKRQTSDLGWEFLKTENEKMKVAQNNSYG